jgi:hypothetical protein
MSVIIEPRFDLHTWREAKGSALTVRSAGCNGPNALIVRFRIELPRAALRVCESCGEYYLSSEVAAQVLEKAESAVKSGAEVEILRFAA